MATLTKRAIDFCSDAYNQLKDDESPNACYIKLRDNGEKYIDYILQKNSWYFGKWALFENSIHVMNIDESLLIEWTSKPLKDE